MRCGLWGQLVSFVTRLKHLFLECRFSGIILEHFHVKNKVYRGPLHLGAQRNWIIQQCKGKYLLNADFLVLFGNIFMLRTKFIEASYTWELGEIGSFSNARVNICSLCLQIFSSCCYLPTMFELRGMQGSLSI